MIKKILLVNMMLITALIVSACGNNDDSGCYVFGTWAAGTELAEFNEIIDRVNENANGEYCIETLSIPSDYYIKIPTLIAANRTPDFFWMTQELISKYAELGVLADITEQLNNSETIPAEDFYEGVLASAQYDGKTWGLPWIANPMMVYYNKDMFEEAGITPPSPTDDWTWDEFIDIAKQLTGTKTDKDGNSYKQYGYIVDGWPNIETFIWAGGGDIIAPDGETILIDSPETIEGVGILQEILQSGISPSFSEINSLGSRNVWFEKQRVAMFMGGIQDDFEKKVAKMSDEDKFEIGYAPMPVGEDGKAHSFDWTASTVMKKQLQGDETAYKALEALTLEFFKWKVAPPIKGLEDTVVDIDPLKADALETIKYSLEIARSSSYVPEWSDINHMLWYDLYVKMLNDKNFDYEKELKIIADESRELIAKRK